PWLAFAFGPDDFLLAFVGYRKPVPADGVPGKGHRDELSRNEGDDRDDAAVDDAHRSHPQLVVFVRVVRWFGLLGSGAEVGGARLVVPHVGRPLVAQWRSP